MTGVISLPDKITRAEWMSLTALVLSIIGIGGLIRALIKAADAIAKSIQ